MAARKRPAPRRQSAPKKTAVKQTAPVKRTAPVERIAPAKRARRDSVAPPPDAAARLDRARRRLPDEERLEATLLAETDAMTRAARTGRRELAEALGEHTATGPELTGGDVDARWDDAYAVGDEAPGGDNPTPDQDRVDDIGRALGVEYQDNEELRGSDKIAERDRHRWELDPASSEDWPHKKE